MTPQDHASAEQAVTWLHRSTAAQARRDPAWVHRMLAALQPWLPQPIGPAESAPEPACRGGREAALDALRRIDPLRYARTRNQLNGAITQLSPWLRHGVLSTAEVRDAACGCVEQPQQAEKLISELAWRDYWQQVYASLGDQIRAPLEPPAAFSRKAMVEDVPEDVLAAETGMACVDAFVKQLHTTGFLHNHARMWLASWLVHTRGVRWQAGAAWFLSRLLDADPASNTLSWQWVAGTFSAKPYIFNRENLERYTEGRWCTTCPHAGHCDVEGTYDDLSAALFTPDTPDRERRKIAPAGAWQSSHFAADSGPAPLVWLTLEALAENSPAAACYPAAPRVMLIDPAWLSRERPSRLRLQFILECLADVERLHLGVGPLVPGITQAVAEHQASGIALSSSVCPHVRQAAATIAPTVPLQVVEGPQLVDRSRVKDLGRFSRYWSKVRASALRPGVASG